MTRTEKSLKNILNNLISTVISIVLIFVVRTIFIQTLGSHYLGLNGLINNILSMLSLAELGIGTAIVFKLYRPLHEKDEKRIKVLMSFYKLSYQIISIFILILGFIFLPFIGFFIKDDTSFTNIYLVFILYLLQTVSSYMFFAYKSSLLKADQKEYVIARYGMLIESLSSIAQIAVLLFLQSFYAYIFVIIVGNVVKNLFISKKVDKDYAYLKIVDSSEKISKEELKSSLKDISALMIYKVNGVVITATDNVVVSSFIGLLAVGMYSNYLLITSALRRITTPIFNSLKASLGNLNVEKGGDATYGVFKIVNLVAAIIYGGSAIGIFILSNRFISVWLNIDFVISTSFALLIAIEYYLAGIQVFLGQFRSSLGLFQQAKYRPLFGIIINVVLSVTLVIVMGINGVILGTIISSLTTFMWFDPIIIHRIGFHKPVLGYFIKNIYYAMIVIITGYVAYIITDNFISNDLLGLIYSGILTAFIIFIVFMITLSFSNEFKELYKYVKRMIKKS